MQNKHVYNVVEIHASFDVTRYFVTSDLEEAAAILLQVARESSDITTLIERAIDLHLFGHLRQSAYLYAMVVRENGKRVLIQNKENDDYETK